MIYNKSEKNKMWDTKKLSDLGKFDRGVSKHRPRNDRKLFEGGGYPFIQTSDIKEANLYILKHTQEYGEFGLKQSKLWDAGTLCITIAANIADIAILSYPMCFPDSVVGFVADKKCCSEEFMYYIFSYINSAIKSIASGSTQDNINLEYLTTLEFKVPPKNYQDRIVKILKNIDDKINLNNKINDNLSNQAELLFLHNFYNKAPNGILGDIIVENEKSKIQVNQAKGIIGKYPFFTSGANILKYNNYFVDGLNCFLNTGGNADIKIYHGKAAYSTDTWCIRAKNDMTSYLYLLLFTSKDELYKKYFKGTGLKHLQKPMLKSKNIYIPSKNEISKFNSYVDRIFTQISQNIKENAKLIQLRDFILPLLINGQATIS